MLGNLSCNRIDENTLTVRCASSLAEFSPKKWGRGLSLPTPLQDRFLTVVEQSGINSLKHRYLEFKVDGQPVGCANVFVSDTDFSTFDNKLPSTARQTIKTWFPDFMRFHVTECGFFTMIGEGMYLCDEAWLPECLAELDEKMARIAHETGSDFLLIRDVPLEKFQAYYDILRKRGYYPSLGFPNTVLPIKWSSLEDYLASLNSKTRLKFRNSLKLKEKFDIDIEFCSDYAFLAGELTSLWKNVNQNAKEYKREFLDECFFSACAKNLPKNSEVLLFKHQGQIIAFMLNLYGDDNYIVLDWGVDYGYEHYRQANLYRAATLLSLDRAITLGKRRLELGITNYTPKMTLGADIVPLVYFVRHLDNPPFSKVLAKLLSDSIVQPDNTVHDVMLATENEPIDIPATEAKVKQAQDDFGQDDIFNKVSRYFRADSMRLSGIYGLYPEFNRPQESSISFSDNREVVLLGTNSYLGVASHPDVVSAAIKAIERYGTGCSGSPLLNGTLDIHNKLEEELAEFLGREAVVLCSTGYQTNLAAISALCAAGDIALMDARNHRSLFDGVKLSGADCLIYRHADMDHLEKLLIRTHGRRRMIITDSLFSMEGTIADLPRLCQLANQYGARTFVDESHAIGVLGRRGRGVCELQGIEDQVDVVMGTFSKSFAALGGFVAGRREVMDYIKHNAGGHIFSASLPASVVETVRAVLRLIRAEPERRQSILDKARFMATSLQELGYQVHYHGSQIVPVILGNYTLALAAYKRFMDYGVYVNPVGPPAVPEQASGFRTSYIATHRWEDLNRALDVFSKHRKDFRFDAEPKEPNHE